MHDHALMKAIKYCGSQSALARALKVDPNRVNNWLNRDKCIPYQYALAIEKLTGGLVTSYELAPYATFLINMKKIVFSKEETLP